MTLFFYSCSSKTGIIEPITNQTTNESDNYYGLEDLSQGLNELQDQIEFNNQDLPENALVKLGSTPSLSAKYILFAPQKKFPWAETASILKKGDLIFSKGNNFLASAINNISSWSHVAIIYDPKNILTLEACDGGVNIYRPLKDWEPNIAWSVKRIKADQNKISYAVDLARKKWNTTNGYTPMPYWPKTTKNCKSTNYVELFKEWFKEWADKNTFTSMYCFKLAYHTFMLININLDSNRTTLTQFASCFGDGFYQKDITDAGTYNNRAFIGVTGDDIYYSKHLGQDLYIYGKKYLEKPYLSEQSLNEQNLSAD